jgi:hypothetical protein
MGRYDKIKVYNGTEFVNPSRIRVYDGKVWQDLGPANSDFKKSMYVRHEGVNKRITLNKQINTIEGDKYRDGAFTAQPSNGYCFCPVSTNAGDYSFSIELYLKRGSAGEKKIFKSWGIKLGGNYIHIILNADNTITVKTSCTFDNKGNLINEERSASKTTTIKIQEGVWNYVKVSAAKGERIVKVQIGESTESLSGLSYTWLVWSDNAVGDTGLYIKDTGFLIKSVDGNGANHSDSNPQANKNESRTEEVWI